VGKQVKPLHAAPRNPGSYTIINLAMTRNPFANAVLATTYIILVVLLMYYSRKTIGPSESILVPMAMLSLLVLSAATMSAIFFYQPVRMYIDGKKNEAIYLFFTTTGIFAGITALAFVILFLLE